MTETNPKTVDRKTVSSMIEKRERARRQIAAHFIETTNYLKPGAIADRLHARQQRMQQRLREQSVEAIRKNGPFVAIAAITALLFANRKVIQNLGKGKKR